MLSNNLRHATPGLGIALVAFGIYLVGEAAYNRINRSDHAHSSSAHWGPKPLGKAPIFTSQSRVFFSNLDFSSFDPQSWDFY